MPSQEHRVRFRPSDYTAALLRVVECATARRTFQQAIEVGVGNGIILSAIGLAHVEHLWGVDIEPDALRATADLLAATGSDARATLRLSDIWNDVAETEFDLIAANLPHYPLALPPKPDRLPTWSGGGRTLIDRFLRGLPGKLRSGGRAYMTHLDLIGLDETLDLIQSLGLEARSVFVWSVCECQDRIDAIFPPGSPRCSSATLRRYGTYDFVDARVLEIGWLGHPPVMGSV
jgi:release factor glutamine methyltransferase